MSINLGSLSSALFAATGEDAALARELRQAFVESAHRQIDLMTRSRCDANWQYSSLRLKGLAASFEAAELIALADEALEGAPGDPVVLRKLAAALDTISAVKPD